jgi:hypothetical protein
LFGVSNESINSSIVQHLSSNTPEPAILIVRGFRNRKIIQKKFFKDLDDIFSMNPSIYKLRILWVDESPPYLLNAQREDWETRIREFFVPLERLNEINELHIRNWCEYQKLDSTKFANLVKDSIEWQEPAKILERICNRLGMEGSIEEISGKLWRF